MIATAVVIEGEEVKKFPIVLAVGVCLVASACSSKGRTPLDDAPSPAAALQQLDTLVVAPEDVELRYYSSDWAQFKAAPDMKQGCSVRDRVLRRQGTGTKVKGGCRITGKWTSPYDGQTVKVESGMAVDHVVGTAEANRSGVRTWSKADKERFGNDERFLVAVSKGSYQQRNGQDPAHWLPRGHRCEYAALYVQAKAAYRLTVDQAEKSALAGVLRGC